MKCPKCGYHSFEHLESCKKCSVDLSEHKAKFGLSGFYAPGQAEPLPDVTGADDAATETAAAEEGNVDFGFDFLEEDGDAPAAEASAPAPEEPADELAGAFDEADEDQAVADDGVALDSGDDVNIDQPFGIDGETVPADESGGDDEKDKESGPGSEFSF